MKLWCCLCFNEEEKEEEDEEVKRNLVMKNDEDIIGNVADDDDGDDDEAVPRIYEARFLAQFGSGAFRYRPATRLSEGESSSVNADVVPVTGFESPPVDESRDSSHKRAKFYK